MAAWVERARREISKSAVRGTAKTAETPVLAVTAVGHPAISEISDPVNREGTSWGWRIIYQDGTKVEAFFSPAVSRDEALRLTPGAVNAEPVVDQKVTTTRVEIPDAWRTLCLEDSRRFGWRVPEALTQAEIDEAVAEAVAERADAITKLAAAFYRHVFGVAHETGCCKPRSGSYCDEGLRLKDAYHEAAS